MWVSLSGYKTACSLGSVGEGVGEGGGVLEGVRLGLGVAEILGVADGMGVGPEAVRFSVRTAPLLHRAVSAARRPPTVNSSISPSALPSRASVSGLSA